MNEPILFVPGTLCNERLFSPQITHFLELNIRSQVARLDGGNTMTQLASAILAHAPEKFALAGLSMGGIIAFEILRLAPYRVTRLALLDTNPRGETPEKGARRLSAINAIDDLEIEGEDGLLPFVENSLFPNYTAASGDDLAALKTTVLQMAKETTWAVGKAQMLALNTRADSAGLLPTITIPTTIICGEQDTLCPVERHEFMHREISHSQLHVLPECGHLSTLEQPDKVNMLLTDWYFSD